MVFYFQWLRFCLALIAACVCAPVKHVEAAEKPAFLETGAGVLMPMGWAGFCAHYPGECRDSGRKRGMEVSATAATIELVQSINQIVNDTIKPLSDYEHWHEIDRWDYAEDGYGDCEDYVLVKRRALIAVGLPASALLVTIVRDENLDGHAVLTVRTDRGDLILDNVVPDVKLWFRTHYRFMKMQSAFDPNSWVAIGSVGARPQLVSR